MTDERKQARLQRIMQQTRVLFINDSLERLAGVRREMDRWRAGEIGRESMGEVMYGFAHVLKGVAQTVGLDDIHRQAEIMTDTIIQYRDAWTEDTFSLLQESFDGLSASLDMLAEEDGQSN